MSSCTHNPNFDGEEMMPSTLTFLRWTTHLAASTSSIRTCLIHDPTTCSQNPSRTVRTYSHPNENHARQWPLDGSGLPLSNTFSGPITLVAQFLASKSFELGDVLDIALQLGCSFKFVLFLDAVHTRSRLPPVYTFSKQRCNLKFLYKRYIHMDTRGLPGLHLSSLHIP